MSCPYETLMSWLLPFNKRNLVQDHNLHQNVKNDGGDWVPLWKISVYFERDDAIAPCLGHREEVIPIDPEDPLHPWLNTLVN